MQRSMERPSLRTLQTVMYRVGSAAADSNNVHSLFSCLHASVTRTHAGHAGHFLYLTGSEDLRSAPC